MSVLAAKTVVAVAAIIAAAAVLIFKKHNEWYETAGWGWFLLLAFMLALGLR